jgi:hypothetical protein
VAASFITSTASIFFPPLLHESSSRYTGIIVACWNFTALVAARIHVGNFWKEKTKVPLPGAGDYNEAITQTQRIRLNLAYLAASWGLCAGLLAVL